MALLWSLLGVLAGAFLAVQAPINAALSRALGLPFAAAALSFVAGSVPLLLIAWSTSQAQGVPIAWRDPPLWMLVGGGLLGAAYVICAILLTPRLGTAATMAFVVSGQLMGGLVLDQMGAFGFAARELSLGRVSGAVLLVAGALLIRIS